MTTSAITALEALTPGPEALALDPDDVKARIYSEAKQHLSRYAHVFSAGDVVLDVGTGPGMTANLIAESQGVEVIGLDIIDSLAPTNNVRLVLYDGRNIPFGDDSADVVLLHYTLHHAEDPERVLSECARIARSHIIIIEEFDLPGGDPEAEELKEASTLAALGLPPDLHHAPLDEPTLESMIRRLDLKIGQNETLPTRSTRMVEKRLYVLEVE